MELVHLQGVLKMLITAEKKEQTKTTDKKTEKKTLQIRTATYPSLPPSGHRPTCQKTHRPLAANKSGGFDWKETKENSNKCIATRNKCIATRNKCIASRNKCLTSSNKKGIRNKMKKKATMLATRNKCIASGNKCLTSSNKKLLGTSTSLLVTSALLVVTRSY